MIKRGPVKAIKSTYAKREKRLYHEKYLKIYYDDKIVENAILLESKNGEEVAGNIFYILIGLQSDIYKGYNIKLAIKPANRKKVTKLLKSYNIKNVKIIPYKGNEYIKALGTSKYLINDTGFGGYFIKKEGQVYLNTWHGTPLKSLGKYAKNRRYAMGNIKRNLLMSDYLLFPNAEMEDKMLEAYGISNLYQGTIINEGYPRNQVFLNDENKTRVDNNNKKIIVYMPTWRGIMNNKKNREQVELINNYMREINAKLDDDYIMYVKLHPFNRSELDLSCLDKVKLFPSNVEVYDFLSRADILITDYSSVFVDFANSGKKIILFTYDLEEYMEERGMFYNIDEMPFPKAMNVEHLIAEINSTNTAYGKDFMVQFNSYEQPGSTTRILETVILGKENVAQTKKIERSKPVTLLYGGSMALNGITSSVKAAMNEIDTEKYDVQLTFRTKSLKRDSNRLIDIKDTIDYFPISDVLRMTRQEKRIYKKYFNDEACSESEMLELEEMYARNFKRFYAGTEFESIIHYHGYEKDIIKLYQNVKSLKSIYVHNNMEEEIRSKGNQHEKTLVEAYNKYDNVVIVTEQMRTPTQNISGNGENIIEINNFIDAKNIIKKGSQNISFGEKTESTMRIEDLETVMHDDTVEKFINIGRFSEEKGQERLMMAFEEYYKEKGNAYLIIIGGYGALYEHLLGVARERTCTENIIIIKNLPNPYPLIKKSDLLILSSFYEALGLVLIEADLLGTPCFSTDIPGSAEFLRENGGTVVSNNKNGILEGIRNRGEIQVMGVNVEESNKKNLEKFYEILNSRR